MAYQLDLHVFSLEDYKEMLKKQNLLPGRLILWESIDDRFQAISKQGIQNAAQLEKALSTPEKLSHFAQSSGVPEEYLVILRREAGSLKQKPVPLTDFPGLNTDLVQPLLDSGIKNSRDYWEKGASRDELYCLCDLVRINGIGAVAAKAFWEAGFTSVSDVANASAGNVLCRVDRVNREKQYYKATLGEKDMQFCIDFAKLIMRIGN
jgi:hypothetical protein